MTSRTQNQTLTFQGHAIAIDPRFGAQVLLTDEELAASTPSEREETCRAILAAWEDAGEPGAPWNNRPAETL